MSQFLQKEKHWFHQENTKVCFQYHKMSPHLIISGEIRFMNKGPNKELPLLAYPQDCSLFTIKRVGSGCDLMT